MGCNRKQRRAQTPEQKVIEAIKDQINQRLKAQQPVEIVEVHVNDPQLDDVAISSDRRHQLRCQVMEALVTKCLVWIHPAQPHGVHVRVMFTARYAPA